MVRNSAVAANYSRNPAPMPPPDDLIGRELVASRTENLPSLLANHPPYRAWDVYGDPATPGVVLLASPRAASV
ncbi:hypothetical protein [Paludisphaera sp.]|uniref:hypothetical protein n=1 Tax=Paludisphaera sp. TaxID=2017432 RepID=UPI00301C43E7